MKKGIKTLAMWLIIGVIIIVLLSSIMENSSSKIIFSELITSVENGDVESVTISSAGTTARVKLKSSKLEKEVRLPSVDIFMEYFEEELKGNDNFKFVMVEDRYHRPNITKVAARYDQETNIELNKLKSEYKNKVPQEVLDE